MSHRQKIAQKSSTRVLLPEINLKKIIGAVHKDNNRKKTVYNSIKLKVI